MGAPGVYSLILKISTVNAGDIKGSLEVNGMIYLSSALAPYRLGSPGIVISGLKELNSKQRHVKGESVLTI